MICILADLIQFRWSNGISKTHFTNVLSFSPLNSYWFPYNSFTVKTLQFRFDHCGFIGWTYNTYNSSLLNCLHSPFIPLETKYSPQEFSGTCISLYNEWPCFTQIHNNWKDYCFIYFHLEIQRRNSCELNVFGLNKKVFLS